MIVMVMWSIANHIIHVLVIFHLKLHSYLWDNYTIYIYICSTVQNPKSVNQGNMKSLLTINYNAITLTLNVTVDAKISHLWNKNFVKRLYWNAHYSVILHSWPIQFCRYEEQLFSHPRSHIYTPSKVLWLTLLGFCSARFINQYSYYVSLGVILFNFSQEFYSKY